MSTEILDTRPLRDDKGNKLTDPQLLKVAIKQLEQHRKKTGKATPLPAKFERWLYEAVEAIDKRKPHLTEAGALQEFKKLTIQEHLDFDIIAKNTVKAQAKDDKKGIYDAKVIKRVKGVSK